MSDISKGIANSTLARKKNVVKVKEVRVSSLFGRVVRESPRKRKLATYGEAEVTSILFAGEEEAPTPASASQSCSKKPRQDPLLCGWTWDSISDPVPSVYLRTSPTYIRIRI